MAKVKEKRYVSDNAQLMAEWDWEKNTELGFDPTQVAYKSNKIVCWKCYRGHEWQAKVSNRSNGKGCPYCSGQKVLVGYNDLKTTNPALASEWHYKRNGALIPENVTANSGKKVWWKCSEGHEWSAPIDSRNRGNGCPYCSGRCAVKGKNDLQTVNPNLANEWNYEKNCGLTPMDVTPNSNRKVWWICNKGHTWQATVDHRNRGVGCPICNSERHTSFPEYILIFYLKKYGLEVIHSYNGNGYELDVYIPEKKVAIEYDGYYWHKNKTNKDLEKNRRCTLDGIKLYRIREGLPALHDSSIDYVIQKDQRDLSPIFEDILSEIIGESIDVDTNRDAIAIENLREYTEKKKSLLLTNPEVASEWNYEKNGNLKPGNFMANSNKKVWWMCSAGHEWQATIVDRNNGRGCPYCSGRRVIKGENDLLTNTPSLANEWNYAKNDGLTPMDVMPNSQKIVWWVCSKGHEWQARIDGRNRGNGCPYCSGRYAIAGETDLATLNPELAKEWHPTRNGELTPQEVLLGSAAKVWWQCEHGHEWQAKIGSRSNGAGCPQCAREKRVNPLTPK